MLATELAVDHDLFSTDPCAKKMRQDSTSSTDSSNMLDTSTIRNLELEGVKELFQDYDLRETEEVACVICGKHYKSKVCVKKHLWEHSIYWDLFDGLKKQQRVLSIQAAIILSIKFNPSLSKLLVTQPSSCSKKKSEKVSPASEKSISHRKRKLDTVDTTSYISESNLNEPYSPSLPVLPNLDFCL